MSNINQQSLYNLISTKLNENSYGVEFNSDLFNSEELNYYRTETTGQRIRFVPTMISDVVGEHLNVPNTNSTSNDVSIQFDVFAGTNDESTIEETEFQYVHYADTLNAIEEFKQSLLAQYFPLGTPYLYMGGEDSKFQGFTSTSVTPRYIYIKFIPYNTDTERLLQASSSTPNKAILTKTATELSYNYDGTNTISIPYTVNTEIELEIYQSDGVWNITDGTNSDASALSADLQNYQVFLFGNVTGFEGLVKRVVITSETVTDINDVITPNIDISTWLSKDSLTNSGDAILSTSSISNCILWSEDGNAVFGFGTTNPISGLTPVDGAYLYQRFEVEASVFISNDVLFGNNFEYSLSIYNDTTSSWGTSQRIYPVDRQHTLATETGSAQYINDNYNQHIVEESSREHTLSFYYIPNKQLTSLLKHIVSGATAQNAKYRLLVQYPFFQVTYDVILESGGTQPNVNTLSTFTVSLKRKDSNLT